MNNTDTTLMNEDFDQKKHYASISEQYENIITAQSTASNQTLEPCNSVHFILNERGTYEQFEEINSFSEAKGSRKGSSQRDPSIEISLENESANFPDLTSSNLLTVPINHSNCVNDDNSQNEYFSENNGKNVAARNELSFEELTGGLSAIVVTDTKNTLFFDDGKRRIDLVLVYEDEDIAKGVLNEQESLRIEYRKYFQESLFHEGLELEIECKEKSYDEKTCFVKIHVPHKILEKYATIMHMKRPVKERENETSFENEAVCSPIFDWFRLDSSLVNDDSALYTSIFTQVHEDKLIIKERERFYTSAQRSQIAWQILLHARFGDDNNIGIRKLLNNNTYISAFPLHEGKFNKDSENGFVYDRRILYLEWARPARWYKYQPLLLVRKYFGDKIALYYAWLGFYTNMLILPSIVGLICFIYGLATMDSSENVPSKEICDPNVAGNITLCPLCDKSCKYQKLGDSCLFSNMTYLFDNTSTVFFSIFMSFWATSFLEMWKRKQAIISWQWDLLAGIEDEETRSEYDTSAKIFKINPVTRIKEPYFPTWRRILQIGISVTIVAFMIFVVFCAVTATILARLMMFTIVSDSSSHNFVKIHAKLITSVMAALMNLLIIIVLTRIYHHIALWLTNKENPRTSAEYEKSIIVKIFLFEFVNYYSSLTYIAFFKGRFFSHPGDIDSRSSLLLRLKGDVCDPAGCLSELCIQLAIIMIGKQWFSNVLELGFPAFRNWWRNRVHNSAKKDHNREYTHWEENYNLQDPGRLALFEEYLEMVIQYGFVTLFVAAFPLAPLFALLNNVCEIRLDAYKMIAQSRRPLAERAEDIGAWFSVLRVLTYCAVVFNAFVIAYTSDYIPRKIYQYFYSDNHDLVGYIDSSLSVFNTSHFPTSHNKLGKGIVTEPEICQYRGYRYGPESADAYELNFQYWVVFSARLLFVVLFEHLVFSITGIIANIIPNVPYQVRRQIQLEKLLVEENNYVRKKKDLDDYDKFLSDVRMAHNNSSRLKEVIWRSTWARRISRRMSSIGLIKPYNDSAEIKKFNQN